MEIPSVTYGTSNRPVSLERIRQALMGAKANRLAQSGQANSAIFGDPRRQQLVDLMRQRMGFPMEQDFSSRGFPQSDPRMRLPMMLALQFRHDPKMLALINKHFSSWHPPPPQRTEWRQAPVTASGFGGLAGPGSAAFTSAVQAVTELERLTGGQQAMGSIADLAALRDRRTQVAEGNKAAREKLAAAQREAGEIANAAKADITAFNQQEAATKAEVERATCLVNISQAQAANPDDPSAAVNHAQQACGMDKARAWLAGTEATTQPDDTHGTTAGSGSDGTTSVQQAIEREAADSLQAARSSNSVPNFNQNALMVLEAAKSPSAMSVLTNEQFSMTAIGLVKNNPTLSQGVNGNNITPEMAASILIANKNSPIVQAMGIELRKTTQVRTSFREITGSSGS